MTLKFINEILEKEGETPVLLEGCVLNITDDRSVIYTLRGDTDYKQIEFEIFYTDKHSDVIWKGTVKTKQELKKIILKNL